jgi:hypothetical protein
MTKSQELLKQASQKIQGVEDGIDCYIFTEAELKAFAEAVACEYFHEMCRSDKIVTLDEFINQLFEEETDGE